MILLLLSVSVFCQVMGGDLPRGNVADSYPYPWLVSIVDSHSHACYGSILSNKIVLTSAKCTLSSSEALSVWAGSFMTLEEYKGSEHRVTAVRRHDDYQDLHGSLVNDLALMVVSPAFQFGERVSSISLSKRQETVAGEKVISIAGWMEERGDEIKASKYVSLRIAENTKCAKPPVGKSNSFRGEFCAALYGNICQRDSGGPLVSNGVQIGIIPWTSSCDNSHNLRLYTSITHQLDWITKVSESIQSELESQKQLLKIFYDTFFLPMFWPLTE